MLTVRSMIERVSAMYWIIHCLLWSGPVRSAPLFAIASFIFFSSLLIFSLLFSLLITLQLLFFSFILTVCSQSCLSFFSISFVHSSCSCVEPWVCLHQLRYTTLYGAWLPLHCLEVVSLLSYIFLSLLLHSVAAGQSCWSVSISVLIPDPRGSSGIFFFFCLFRTCHHHPIESCWSSLPAV